jgi:chromosome segregation ATPase
MRKADVGLRDHKEHIGNLLRDNASALWKLRAHDSVIKKLAGYVTSLRSESKQIEQIRQDARALRSTDETRANAHSSAIQDLKSELHSLCQQNSASDTAPKISALSTLQEEKETRTMNRKTGDVLEEVQEGLHMHAKLFDKHHNDIRDLATAQETHHTDIRDLALAQDTLQQSHIITKQEVSNLSNSLGVRTQNVDMQLLAPHRPS